MCTAINETENFHLFGRTLDVEKSFGERVVIVPSGFNFSFMHEGQACTLNAIIGMAHLDGKAPLFYDGMNEHGLCAAALRFPELCKYHEATDGKINLASFELIPYILANFNSASAAKAALTNLNITPDSFSDKLPTTELHWIVADKFESFVIESREDGVHIYDNPYGVLTNAPDFPTQCFVLDNFRDPLLGDLSSSARFNRAVNAKMYTTAPENNEAALTRFFHILGTVNQPDGLFRADARRLRTLYTSCMDTENKTYYFTTYDCRTIYAVKLSPKDSALTAFPIAHKENIQFLN